MTFNELAHTLPNGFHDAELHRFEIDYVRRVLQFTLMPWIGDTNDITARELYRPCRVTVHDVAYLVIEPPDTNYRWLEPGPICIDTDEGQPTQSDSKLPVAPVGSSVTWMYLGEMNRFLLFAAGHASLEWTGPEENRTR